MRRPERKGGEGGYDIVCCFDREEVGGESWLGLS